MNFTASSSKLKKFSKAPIVTCDKETYKGYHLKRIVGKGTYGSVYES